MLKMGVTIIADAVSNLFFDIRKAKKLNIRIMNLHLHVGDKEFLCYDKDLNLDEFLKHYYEKMKEDVEVQTSLASPGDYEKAFKEEIEMGNRVICFSMASGISGTYNSACLARDLVNEEFKEEKVAVIDSMTAGFGEGLQAIHAYELVEEGKSFEEVVKEAEDFKHYVRSDFTVDDIKYLVKTGRVPKALARFMNLLKIKVMLKRSDKSNIAFAGSAIGKNGAITSLVKTVASNIDTSLNQIIYITHCNAIEDANKLKDLLEKRGLKNIEIYDYDVISGAHIGPGSLAIFYVGKKAY